MNVGEMLQGAQDALAVSRVYGEPIQKNGVTLIPAAEVLGGGGGGSDEANNGGGGFGVRAACACCDSAASAWSGPSLTSMKLVASAASTSAVTPTFASDC